MRALLLVLALTLAGCADEGATTTETSDLKPELTFVSDASPLNETDADATIRLAGVGWGQFRLHLNASTLLAIQHPDLDLSSFAADRDQAYYPPGAYTVVHVAGASTHWFAFLGAESGFQGPRDSGTGSMFQLTPGDWTVTVANSVPGYSLQVGGGTTHVDMTLGGHDGFYGGVIEGREVQGIDAGMVQAVHEVHHVQELPKQPPSFLVMESWSSQFTQDPVPAMAHLELGARSMAFQPLGTPVTLGAPLPGFGFGAYTGGAMWVVHATDTTQDLQATFAHQTTGVVVGTHADGVTLVALPLA